MGKDTGTKLGTRLIGYGYENKYLGTDSGTNSGYVYGYGYQLRVQNGYWYGYWLLYPGTGTGTEMGTHSGTGTGMGTYRFYAGSVERIMYVHSMRALILTEMELE